MSITVENWHFPKDTNRFIECNLATLFKVKNLILHRKLYMSYIYIYMLIVKEEIGAA